MNLQVQLFAAARDAAGQSPVEVRLPAGGSVGDLRKQLLQDFFPRQGERKSKSDFNSLACARESTARSERRPAWDPYSWKL